MRHGTAALALGALAALLLSGPAFAAGGGAGAAVDAVATAYGPSASDNFPYGATDYFGRPLSAGDVAVDPSVIPLGSCIRVAGYRSPDLPAGGFVGQADDEGGAIRGRRVDIYLGASAAAVQAFGVQRVQVTVLGPPTDPGVSGTAACAGYVGGKRQPHSPR
jgi:3D (Asp-Asp-Asp) domain-containing protein